MNLRSDVSKRLCVEDLQIGMKVTYKSFNKKEHGIVKSISDHEHVFVVYNCAGNWNKYYDFTAARTNVRDLEIGWVT